jgi:chloride channel, nucleotide-sensitive, 1A
MESCRSFLLFSPSAESGIAIPYPSITLHAIKHLSPSSSTGIRRSGIYLQLELTNSDPDDEDFETTELTLIPSQTQPQDSTTPSTQSETSKLFDAISICSNLNPDPISQDDSEDDGLDDRIVFDHSTTSSSSQQQTRALPLPGFAGAVLSGSADGGLPPPMPGSGGWITAENMHEFFDSDGNWLDNGEGGAVEDDEEEWDDEEGISGELGDGAGRVRTRDEVDGVATAVSTDAASGSEVNGHHDPGDDTDSKRIRTA